MRAAGRAASCSFSSSEDPRRAPLLGFLVRLQLEILQPRPARVRDVAIAAALPLVQVGPAHRAEPLAALLAHGVAGKREEELLADDRVEVDDLPRVRLLLRLGRREAAADLPLSPSRSPHEAA